GRAGWQTALARSMVSIAGVIGDTAVIVIVALLAGVTYHLITYNEIGELGIFLEVGAAGASIFVLPSLIRGEYALRNFFSFKPHVHRIFNLWNVTFLCLLTVGFLAKTTDVYSRGTIVLFYLAGFPAILLARSAVVRATILGSKIGLVSAQRVFLIGSEADIAAFVRRYQPWNFGLHIVGMAPLTPLSPDASPAARRASLIADIEEAVGTTRARRPEAIFIIAPWSDAGLIDLCVEEFLTIPVEIHLGPERILDRFDNVRISKLGPMASLQLTRVPLSSLEVLQKRLFDIVAAAAGVMLPPPVMPVVADLLP